MKRRFLISLATLFLSSGVLLAKGASKELDITDFSKGVDTYHDSVALPDGYAQDVLNVYFNRQALAEKRKGFTLLFSSKSYAYLNSWNYTDSTSITWLIVRASDTILASNLAGTVVKISTISSLDNVDETTAFGNAYFVDPTQGVYYWNGASTTYVSGSPKGSIIAQFHSRVWVSGQAVPNGNLLNASKFLDGNTWTTGPNPSDPVQFTIGLQDNFENITTLYPFLDTLYVMKYSSIYALYGFDQPNFQNSILTRECGCIDKNTVQAYNKGLRFVSLRGVEAYDGYTCTRISDPIKNKIDNAISITSFNQAAWTLASQADFQTGVASPTIPSAGLSYTISPGDIVISSFSILENTSASGWGNGTASSVTVADGSLSLTLNNLGTVDDPSFETGAGSTIDNWATGSGTGKVAGFTGDCNATPQAGSWMTQTGCGLYVNCLPLEFRALDSSGNTLQSVSVSITQTCTWAQYTLTPSATNLGKRVKFRFHAGTIAGAEALTTSASFIWGGPISFYAASGIIYPNTWLFFDNVTLGSSTISSGTFVSQAYNTGIPYGTLLSSVGWVVASDTPSFIVQQASSSLGNWNTISVSTGVNINISKQYLRYLSTFTAVSNAQSYISSVNLIEQSSGSYYSAVHNAPNVNTWGNFVVTDNSVGNSTVTYLTRASTNSFTTFSSTPAWVAQTKNATISASTGTYMQWSATFTVTAATETSSVSDATMNWYSGVKANPMSSVVYDNRYWLSVSTTPSSSANNTVLVQDITGVWTIFGINAGTFSLVKNALYHGDSSSTGNVYQDDQGYSDNGIAINAFVKTKDYNIGSQIVDTLFDSVWPSAVNLDSTNLQLFYSVDKGTSTYSLATIPQSEFANTKYARIPFPFSSAQANIGQTINFTIQNNTNNGQMQFEGMTFLYHDRQPLE